jgi:hypothetical protein
MQKYMEDRLAVLLGQRLDGITLGPKKISQDGNEHYDISFRGKPIVLRSKDTMQVATHYKIDDQDSGDPKVEKNYNQFKGPITSDI